jgi:alpha-tubulin suppressor-like RCC1 family protein
VYAGGSGGYNGTSSLYGNGYTNNITYAIVSTMLYDNVVDISSIAYPNGQNSMSVISTENGSLYWWGYNSGTVTAIVNNLVVNIGYPSTATAIILWHPSGFPYGPNPTTYSSNNKIYKYILNTSGIADTKLITILLKNGNIFTIGSFGTSGTPISGIGSSELSSTTWSMMVNHRKDIIDIVSSSIHTYPTIHMLTSTGDIYSTGDSQSGQIGNGMTSNSHNNVYKMIL